MLHRALRAWKLAAAIVCSNRKRHKAKDGLAELRPAAVEPRLQVCGYIHVCTNNMCTYYVQIYTYIGIDVYIHPFISSSVYLFLYPGSRNLVM